MIEIIQKVKTYFHKQFGEAHALLVAAPGRINMIGEHTDYNMGLVLPAAIDRCIYMAIGPAKHATRIVSMDLADELVVYDLEHLKPHQKAWPNYLLGVVDEMLKDKKMINHFNVVFAGNVPLGAGMSSSAALENAIAFGLNELFELEYDRISLAKLSQKAEHNFVGTKCGIMDQFTSMMGSAQQVIKLDCRDLSYEYVRLDLKGYCLLLVDSNLSHHLTTSEYNLRRRQCEMGVQIIANKFAHVTSLRDVDIAMLDACVSVIDPVVYKRCQYIIEENLRVVQFCDLMEAGDVAAAGNILFIAHRAMRDQYEITCPEIDWLASMAETLMEVVGARMMGGGFGRFTINLIETTYLEDFKEFISNGYRQKYAIEPGFYEVNISNGVCLLE